MFAEMMIKQFAEQFKEQLIETETELKSKLRYTVEVLPTLEYNSEKDTYKEGKETALCLWNPEGCISEEGFTEMIDKAENSGSSESKQMFSILESFGISSISEWLINHMETERKKQKADKYFFMLFLKTIQKKNKLTRKIRTETVGIFQMFTQTGNDYKTIQEFTV